ncbi:hypothetical protein [Legionella bozemanae]|uniref:hypothetical protein n=1 Tax=Legionella bozemanae TaxID=447 RepID=UPI00399D145C
MGEIRRALAFNNQCHYCMAKAGPPEQDPQDERLIEALRFANLFSITHESADKNEITQYKEQQTPWIGRHNQIH